MLFRSNASPLFFQLKPEKYQVENALFHGNTYAKELAAIFFSQTRLETHYSTATHMSKTSPLFFSDSNQIIFRLENALFHSNRSFSLVFSESNQNKFRLETL